MEKYEKPSTAGHTDADEDDDVLWGPIPTFEEAIAQRKELIAQLKEGDRGERRLAAILARCRKGSRCNLVRCPVCERRKLVAVNAVPASVVKAVGSLDGIVHIKVGAIKIIGKRRPLNEAKVRALAASINEIGLQTPITVQNRKKDVVLTTGWYRLEAVKRLSWTAIPCIVLGADKIDVSLWQLAENYYRAELTVLERAECTEGLRALIRQKREGGQVAPPGGHQPKDTGIKATARALGVAREEIRRSKRIAKISPAAKAKVRKLGLDDNQRALLEIASQPTPKAELRTVREIVERKRAAAHARNGSVAAVVGDKKTTAEINTLEADIREKQESLERLQGKLAANRKRLREIEDKLAIQGVAKAGDGQSIVPDEDADQSAHRIAGEGKFERLKVRWKKYLAPDWKDASEKTRARFVAEVLGYPERVS